METSARKGSTIFVVLHVPLDDFGRTATTLGGTSRGRNSIFFKLLSILHCAQLFFLNLPCVSLVTYTNTQAHIHQTPLANIKKYRRRTGATFAFRKFPVISFRTRHRDDTETIFASSLFELCLNKPPKPTTM